MAKRKFNESLWHNYEKLGGSCFYCKRKVNYDDITEDHVIPKSKGYTLVNNCVFACHTCNQFKSNSNLNEFKNRVIEKINSIIETKNDLIQMYKNNPMILYSLSDLKSIVISINHLKKKSS